MVKHRRVKKGRCRLFSDTCIFTFAPGLGMTVQEAHACCLWMGPCPALATMAAIHTAKEAARTDVAFKQGYNAVLQ